MAVITSKTAQLPDLINYVEWIESSGSQYVDTGFKPNNNTHVVADIQVVTLSGYAPLFGARIASRNNEFATWAIDETSYQDGFGTSMTAGLAAKTTDRNTVDKNKNRFIVNETTLTTHAAATFQSNLNLYIFNINTNGSLSGSYKTYARLFSFQIYDNDALVRDLRPCYDPEGVACLYDRVEKKYYYNAGTGSFTAGGAA